MPSPLPVRRIELPTPYAVGPVNCYLIEAEPLTLVDCGINTPQARSAFLEALASASVAPEDVRQVIVTHAHPDHYGLVHVIQEATGHSDQASVTVYFPAREIARVRDRQMLFEVGRLLIEAGMPMDLLFKMDQQRKQGPRSEMNHDHVVPLYEGHTFHFDRAGMSFTLVALHMPGHTGGHMVFHEPKTSTLFAGDQLLPDVSPNPLLEPSLDAPGERRRSLREYLDSLARMGDLRLGFAYPGHGDPIEDPRSLIQATIEHHRKRKAQVAAHLGPEGKTPYQLAGELYPNVTGYDIFLSVSEVVAHLDLVVEDGGALVEERDSVTYYRAS